MSDQLLTRLEALGPDEWHPEPPPPLRLPPAPRRRRALVLRPLPALAAALVLLALGAGGALIATSGDEPRGRAIALAPLVLGAGGEARLQLAGGGRRATLVASGLRPSRRGEFYELWLLRPDAELVALGSFRVGADGRARIQVPLPVSPSEYRFVDVSVEPDDGDPAHSTRSVLRGRVD